MDKKSHRPKPEQIKGQGKERKKAWEELRRTQQAEGLEPLWKAAIPNRKSGYGSVEEEHHARQEALGEQMMVFRSKLPVLLKRLSAIKDPRNPKKIKYHLTVLMLYGILSFVFQMASRREANREMTYPVFMENLKKFFPELYVDGLPHNDTLKRIVDRIDVEGIENSLMASVRSLIRKKKFFRYLVDNRYPIAIDGTQKCVRDVLWTEHCLERDVGKGDDTHMQYYVYVVEAGLAFAGGMTIPLMSEFLSYPQGDSGSTKQDCETKGFKRLAERLKREFSHLPIMLLLDGLYPTGPILELFRKNKWDYMIVLQDKSLPSVWEEYEGLKKLEEKNRFSTTWGDRRQSFTWINGIEYFYGDNGRKRQMVNLVVCEERWEEVAKDSAQTVSKASRHAWISGKPLNKCNLHERCNLAARHRWNIESGILIEKHHGYHYEHLFSYNWNAMKGFHYLMRIGHLINILALYSERLAKTIRDLTMRGFIRFVRNTISGPWLDPLWVKRRLESPFQLRLI
jgi:hypothetical protein